MKKERDAMSKANEEQSAAQSTFDVVHALDEGIRNHEAWIKGLHQTLVCDEAHANGADLGEEPHRCCAFGRWYYGDAQHSPIHDHKLFVPLGDIHQSMHGAARDILLAKEGGERIEVDAYDRFINQANLFKLEVRNIQYDMMSRVCAVDQLTGVWNRYAMQFKLNQEHERVSRGNESACIAVMDLDHFKVVNDTHGHPEGDHVLRTLIGFCRGRLRKYDSMFRYGGEEFLICLPDTNQNDAAALIERLREAVAATPIRLSNGEEVCVTASFGVACLAPDKQLDDAIHQADTALLRAKQEGRDRVRIWGE